MQPAEDKSGAEDAPAFSSTPPSDPRSHHQAPSAPPSTLIMHNKEEAHQSESPKLISEAPKNPPEKESSAKAPPSALDSFQLPLPFTPKMLLQHYSSKLTPFEMSEVLDYPRMYFFGPSATKIKGIPWAQNNNGYDDARGDLRLVRHDHLAYRYELLEKLGKGSFGQVVKALDHKTGEHVAIKVIRNKKRFHRQALIEIKILEHVQAQGNSSIVDFKGHFTFRNHLCLTFELLSINLYELIKSDNFKGYQLKQIQNYARQLLSCLEVLRKENIIHCDLKPENILLDLKSKSTIKVIDFGSSCFGNEKLYTYIQSRFYRSPEVVLGLPYNPGIDMWSLGCILAELFNGYPLFPGENELDLISRIIEVLGNPPKEMAKSSTSKHLIFDPAGNLCIGPNDKVKVRIPGSRTLGQALKCEDQDFLDFLSVCLAWSSDQRLTPSQGLEHPWFKKVYTIDEGNTEKVFGLTPDPSQENIQRPHDPIANADAPAAPPPEQAHSESN